MPEIVEPPVMQNGLPLVAHRNAIPATDRDTEGRNTEGQPRQRIGALRAGRPEVTELAEAVDQYKLRHRRRYLSFEELYEVIAELGYSK
jgi:hypothetical protein